MSNAAERTYCGVCVRLRDAVAYFEVRGQFDGASILDLSHSSHGLFPPKGEVELRPNPTNPVSRGVWMAFGVEGYGPPGHVKFRAVDARRLLPFEDLADIGDAESVRRLLVEEGRIDDFPGARYVQTGDREMVRIDVRQCADGRWRVSRETDLSSLPVWEYRPELRLRVSDGLGTVSVVSVRTALRQIGTTLWSSDADIVRRIVGAMRDKSDPEDTARRQFADALLRYADQLERGGETSHRGVDAFTARRVLRLRRVASALRDQQDVLQEYFELLRQDPEVRALLHQKMAAAVEAEVESQRASIRQTLELELDRDMAEVRDRRKAELEKSMGELDTEMMENLERRAAARSAEVDRQIAEREKEGLEEIERSLSDKHSTLEAEVFALEDRRSALAAETTVLDKKKEALDAELRDLSERQNRATEIVEKWTSIASALGARPGSFALAQPSIPVPDRASEPSPVALRTADFENAIAGCTLLTNAGKDMLVRLAALMLAGEVPLLHGPECDDFIEIAQAYISNGRHARLEADPTIIAFDDLWIRPGTQVATPLRQALAEASGERARTKLCVISNADLSGARFWYPALAEKARRAELPPRLLICATLKDPKSEEAEQLVETGLALEIKDVIAPKASTVAPAILKGPSAKIFELQVQNQGPDLTAAVHLLASISAPLGVRDAERVARIFVAAGLLVDSAHAEALARSAASHLSGAPQSSQGENVIPLGGSGRA
jgi:hypothetical protein